MIVDRDSGTLVSPPKFEWRRNCRANIKNVVETSSVPLPVVDKVTISWPQPICPARLICPVYHLWVSRGPWTPATLRHRPRTSRYIEIKYQNIIISGLRATTAATTDVHALLYSKNNKKACFRTDEHASAMKKQWKAMKMSECYSLDTSDYSSLVISECPEYSSLVISEY